MKDDRVALAQRLDEMIHEALGGDEQHLALGLLLADAPGDGIEQMGLAEARRGMDEQRIEADTGGSGMASATRSAAAWARRFEVPTMKLSKVWLGSSGDGRSSPETMAVGESGDKTAASGLRKAGSVWRGGTPFKRTRTWTVSRWPNSVSLVLCRRGR